MHRQRGFTLVELLFALLILTIIILTSLAVFVERNRRLQQAAETMLVYQALANEAEVVKRVAFGQLDTLSDDFTSGTLILDPISPYDTNVDVTTVSSGVKQVDLVVRWRSGQREAMLSVMRADTGGTTFW